MTTNKPEVLAAPDMTPWEELDFSKMTRRQLVVYSGQQNFKITHLQAHNDQLNAKVRRQKDALRQMQADYERLRKHLQNLIDQTTPLEPEPGNPMWSRRIQLDEVIAERDQLRAECEKLRKDADQYRRLIELGEDFQWENIIRIDIEDFPSRAAAIDAAMQGRQP